jgi:biotin transport system permease protein
MAQPLAFHYSPGHSLLHCWDARCKLLAVIVVSLLLWRAFALSLAGFSLILAATSRLARLPSRAMLKELRSWFGLLLVFFVMHAGFTPGAPPPALPWIPCSQQGLTQGALACWRLGLLLGYAALFTATTRPRSLREAITWCLLPFKFLPANRIAFMVSLTLRLLPMVLDQLAEVKEAHQARLGNLGRRPLRRSKHLMLPLFRRTLIQGDDLALALAARGYREDLPLDLPRLPYRQMLPVCLLLALWLCQSGRVWEWIRWGFGP